MRILGQSGHMHTIMGMILPLVPLSTAEGGDRGKIIGVFAARIDQPRPPTRRRSGAGAGIGRQAALLGVRRAQ
ncbi:hypothetical protein GCM10028793_09620 [Nocardiopsis oceani]